MAKITALKIIRAPDEVLDANIKEMEQWTQYENIS